MSPFLSELLRTPSPSGFEAPGQRVWAGYVREVADRVESDTYGSAWAVLDGHDDVPSLLLEAHADEIGLIIQHVTDAGFLRINRIGGSDRAIARGKRVVILGDNGPVRGVVGNTAIHIRDTKDEKAPEWHELFVDVGASDKAGVTALGLRVGHPAVYADEPEPLNEHHLVGRALDNRIGGYIIAEALRRLADDRPAGTVTALNSVQEEIGGHGATMAAYRLRPAVALVVDVTHATDTPGVSQAKHGDVKLGAGPTLTHGTANHPHVVRRLMALAEQEGIAIQHEASSRYTGTDTDSIFRSRTGIASALISLPMRYMHSTVETVDLRDVDACIRLMAAFAKSLKAGDTFGIDLG
ncbi:MAG: M42 family metallopeptidase [Bacteroidota bacterium]